MQVRPCADADEMRAAFAPIWHYFGQNPPTERRDFAFDIRQAAIVDVGQDDVGAGPRHGQGGAAAEIGRAHV